MGRPATSRTVERAVKMEKGRAGYQSNLEEGCKKREGTAIMRVVKRSVRRASLQAGMW
jgi:hypothetical protein